MWGCGTEHLEALTISFFKAGYFNNDKSVIISVNFYLANATKVFLEFL